MDQLHRDRSERGEITRERLLNAALAAIAVNGYAATGVAEICQRAGVSKGAFYHHFESKQALFMALLGRWLSEIETEPLRLQGHAPTAAARILRMVEAAGHVFQSAAGQLPIILEFWAEASRDPAIRPAVVEPYHRFRALFSGIIAAGTAEGSFAPVDPQVAAQALLSLAVGVMLQGMLDPAGADWGHVLRGAVEMFLHGLEVKP